jgi:hypothetical protein
MAAKKVELKTINFNDHETFKIEVERFIGKIANPETMKIQFEVKEYNNEILGKQCSYWAFILFDGELTK